MKSRGKVPERKKERKNKRTRTLGSDGNKLNLERLRNELEGAAHVMDEVETDRGGLFPSLQFGLAGGLVRRAIADQLHKGAQTNTIAEIVLQVFHGHAARAQVGVNPGRKALKQSIKHTKKEFMKRINLNLNALPLLLTIS